MFNCGSQNRSCLQRIFKKFQTCSIFTKRYFYITSSNYAEDFYKVLGVSKTASSAEIKEKYFELCKQHHPDKNRGTSQDKFVKINTAYTTLSNPQSRREYDNVSASPPFTYDPRYHASTTSNRKTQYHKNYRPYPDDRFNQRQDGYYKQRAEYWRKYYKGVKEKPDVKTEQMHREWEDQKARWEDNYQKQNFKNINRDKMNDFWDIYYKEKSRNHFNGYKSFNRRTEFERVRRKRQIFMWLLLIYIFCIIQYDLKFKSNSYRNFTPVSYNNPHVGTETIKHPSKEEIDKE